MVTVLQILALAGFLACCVLLLWITGKDRANRGMRVSNGRIYRERVTKTIPGKWLDKFEGRYK